jgi:hypothetical protein
VEENEADLKQRNRKIKVRIGRRWRMSGMTKQRKRRNISAGT